MNIYQELTIPFGGMNISVIITDVLIGTLFLEVPTRKLPNAINSRIHKPIKTIISNWKDPTAMKKSELWTSQVRESKDIMLRRRISQHNGYQKSPYKHVLKYITISNNDFLSSISHLSELI